VSAEVVSCEAQSGAGDYTCTLQVTFGGPLEINTVWRVALGGAEFLTTSGSPGVSGSTGCAYPPNTSPYYPGAYYDVNISTDGCQSGAVIVLTEAVTGTAAASTTHSISAQPGQGGTAIGTAQASYALPAGPAGTPTPAAASLTPTPAVTSTPTAAASPTPAGTPSIAAGAASPTPIRTATPPPAPTATRPPASPATPTPTPAEPPRASDGQHLGLQPPAVQAAFIATHGDAAAQRWADEHEAELARPAP
jgi:hypothetical protein